MAARDQPTRDTVELADDLERPLRDYRLIERLGDGGMGVVYKAHQSSMDRLVALKILADHLATDREFVERFFREARMSAQLDHPNVVRGLAVWKEGARYYFAMEFVDGEDTARILTRLGTLSVGDAVRIALDVGRALQHAEQRGLVHRDVKPANIRITNDGVVKLLDLGLAKRIDDESGLTRTGGVFGTPTYMSPEQIATPHAVDGRTDIYALGVTLYQYLAGRKPFTGHEIMMLAAKQKGDFEPASRHNAAVPPELDAILRQTMAPRPGDRFQTAGELVEALSATRLANREFEFLVNRSEASRVTVAVPSPIPPPSPRRAPDGGRPSRRTVLAVGAALLLGGLGLLAAWYGPWNGRAPARSVEPAEEQLVAAKPAPKPEAEPQGINRLEVNRVLARVSGAIGSGEIEKARELLTAALARYPESTTLLSAVDEIDRGMLVLFQHQTPSETSPLFPLREAVGTALTSQDNYRFAVVPSRACFVYAFQIDAKNALTQLFPNAGLGGGANPLRAGRTHWIPGEQGGARSWLHLDATTGTERVYFVGLTRPLPDPDAIGRALTDAPETIGAELSNQLGDSATSGGVSSASCFAGDPVQAFSFRHR